MILWRGSRICLLLAARREKSDWTPMSNLSQIHMYTVSFTKQEERSQVWLLPASWLAKIKPCKLAINGYLLAERTAPHCAWHVSENPANIVPWHPLIGLLHKRILIRCTKAKMLEYVLLPTGHVCRPTKIQLEEGQMWVGRPAII